MEYNKETQSTKFLSEANSTSLVSEFISGYIRNRIFIDIFKNGNTIQRCNYNFWLRNNYTICQTNSEIRKHGRVPPPKLLPGDNVAGYSGLNLPPKNNILASNKIPKVINFFNEKGLQIYYVDIDDYLIGRIGNTLIELKWSNIDYISIQLCGTENDFFDKEEFLEKNQEYQDTPPETTAEDKSLDFYLLLINNGCNTYQHMRLFTEKFETFLNINYSDSVIKKTNNVVAEAFADSPTGKNLILRGNPGTGKSYWIKGFAKALEGRYTPVLITQPQEFFSSPIYYLEAISHFSGQDSKRFARLIFIIEDCGKLLSMESQLENPQVESILLNITDGILGSGREDLFIFTFNFDLGMIDNAIIRAGRLLEDIEFPLLNSDEAKNFLEKNGHTSTYESADDIALADLYAILYGKVLKSTVKTKPGF